MLDNKDNSFHWSQKHKKNFYLYPSVYPALLLTVCPYPNRLSSGLALKLYAKHHSYITIVEKLEKSYQKHKSLINSAIFDIFPLNKISECNKTYYRLSNYQNPLQNKSICVLYLLLERCHVAITVM